MSGAPPMNRVPALVVRGMRWWDIQACAGLEPVLFPGEEWRPETFWSVLARHRTYRAWVAEDAGRIAGYAVLSWSGPDADVQTLAVRPEHQGRGLGRRLLRAMIDEAGRRGAQALLLEVRADNTRAQALYESAGFERIAVRRGYYQPAGVDALVLRLLRPGDRTRERADA